MQAKREIRQLDKDKCRRNIINCGSEAKLKANAIYFGDNGTYSGCKEMRHIHRLRHGLGPSVLGMISNCTPLFG
jgi:uncharacterized membrane protein YsdA (DUF1294 family)